MTTTTPTTSNPPPDDFAWRLRGHLYRRIRDTGAAPTRTELGEQLGASREDVAAALRHLADAHALALDDLGEVWMAHPFSAVPTNYRVETPVGDYWANCAWDAIAIPLLIGTDGRTRTTCPHSGRRLDLTVRDGRAYAASGTVIRFPVPANRFWDDIGFT